MFSVPDPYCKSALFTCTCCSYSTTIYSDNEWLGVTDDPSCNRCAGVCEGMTNQAHIFRDDIDEDFPLHYQLSLMPDGKHFCEHAPYPNGYIHWTTLLVSCPVCEQDTMLFTQYRQGENILEFYEQCADQKKLAHPPLMWIDGDGHHCLHFSWSGNDFSAT